MDSQFSDFTTDESAQLDQIRSRKLQLLGEIQHLQDELARTNTRIESVIGTPEKHNTLSNRQSLARKKFNDNPRKGLRHMIESGLLANGTAENVARYFLFSNDGIKKSAIGDFLGERDDFNLEVLDHFVRLQDFRSPDLVQMMRNFLSRFRLPGEAQKIDRIMECFAKHYCAQNPKIFDNPDTCYTLCYAIIMLNTSLHNPNVKERMKLENFLQITDSMNVAPEFVAGIYNSIRSEELKFPAEEDNFAVAIFHHAEKQGWLQKQGSHYKTWNKRWFILSNRCLYYFECINSKEPKGIVPLENVRVRIVGQEVDTGKWSSVFEIYSPNTGMVKGCKNDSEGRLVEGQHSVYRLAAMSREEMHSWISSIQRSINRDPSIEEMLELHRRRIDQQRQIADVEGIAR